jgi:eukaryotic-like serine/threonine-protein kinase
MNMTELTAGDSRLIQTEIGSPPSAHSTSGLPEDLLQQAAHRLVLICAVIAGLWSAELLLGHLVTPIPTQYPDTSIFRLFEVLGASTLAVSLGLFWYARRSRRDPRFLLNLGLVYEVLIALSVGLLDWAYNMPVGLSWMSIIILIFAAIIPAPPAKTLAVALLAASMDPAGAIFWKAAGQQHVPGAGDVFLHAFPNYLCALIAPIFSHIITGLGREVKKARAMGSYVLDSLIGSGGMGEVWRANHRFLARPAAIKLIKPEVLGAMTKEQRKVLVERFRREAQAAAMLRSPHTIHLYDFGVTSDGTFYYVMELLNGMDLQTLVTKHGPLPPARAIYLLQQACESLAEAHRMGLVHRDIKPANIQVCRMGDYSDWVKVLDFGLVKTLGGDLAEAGLTAPHTVTGTPAYLSPESALGELVDQRADIYALGCVAYWMLTGRYVFTGETAMQIVARHASSEPTAPSRHSGFDVSPALDELVLACLKKKPSERPATARELCIRLSECAVETGWTKDDATSWWEGRMEVDFGVSSRLGAEAAPNAPA